MTEKDKGLIKEFCDKKLKTRTDWTGTRVETAFECESVDDFVCGLFSYIEDNK